MRKFKSNSDFYHFVNEVASKLRTHSYSKEADILQNANTLAYTTSSEWIGEVGRAVSAISKNLNLKKKFESEFADIMAAVKKVWPDFNKNTAAG